MKKKYSATVQDKKDWAVFAKNPNDLYDKEANFQNENNRKNKIIKLDLHGFSLNEANKKVKKFIIKSNNLGYKKLSFVASFSYICLRNKFSSNLINELEESNCTTPSASLDILPSSIPIAISEFKILSSKNPQEI